MLLALFNPTTALLLQIANEKPSFAPVSPIQVSSDQLSLQIIIMQTKYHTSLINSEKVEVIAVLSR